MVYLAMVHVESKKGSHNQQVVYNNKKSYVLVHTVYKVTCCTVVDVPRP